jgi:hypothetical protein
MSNRSRQTFLKRQKELARQERQRNKSEKRAQRKQDREKPLMVAGEDPDIVGIVPGPQALPWEDMEQAEDESTESAESAESSSQEEQPAEK